MVSGVSACVDAVSGRVSGPAAWCESLVLTIYVHQMNEKNGAVRAGEKTCSHRGLPRECLWQSHCVPLPWYMRVCVCFRVVSMVCVLERT